jgi:hypothetical protein
MTTFPWHLLNKYNVIVIPWEFYHNFSSLYSYYTADAFQSYRNILSAFTLPYSPHINNNYYIYLDMIIEY